MRATGIVRRIDDLGRVVIPKEIRRTLRIREGDLADNIDRRLSFRECNKGYCGKTTYWGMRKAVRVSPGGFEHLYKLFKEDHLHDKFSCCIIQQDEHVSL